MNATAAIDLAPLARMALLGVVVAAGPLAWLWLRHRHARPLTRLHRLTLLTLFLTFDLVLFGAFTRLTDSGLGCPDWPGCYGSASPIGARDEIGLAQAQMPTGPVTLGKAWIEMVHRYLATGVGVLITVMTLVAWLERRRLREIGLSPWWPTATLAWVCIQGAFGALTVTLKLYPAIVTAHLLGGMALLVLLAAQARVFAGTSWALCASQRRGLWLLAGLSAMQVALGGWVSTNYAVLACSEFPTCQGSWWPPMDFANAFHVQRELGTAADGSYLPFAALTAIHMTHRLMAVPVLLMIGFCAWRLWPQPAVRRWALGLAVIGGLQLISGLSNVVLGWPLLAAVGHTAGAAALVVLLTVLLTRSGADARMPRRQASALGRPAGAAP